MVKENEENDGCISIYLFCLFFALKELCDQTNAHKKLSYANNI